MQTWGKCIDKWHDEVGPYHLLRDDCSPSCGVKYYYTTGGGIEGVENHQKCKRCLKIAAKLPPELWGRAKYAPDTALVVFSARAVIRGNYDIGSCTMDIPPDRKSWSGNAPERVRLRMWLEQHHSRFVNTLYSTRPADATWDAPYRFTDGNYVYEATIVGGYVHVGAWIL